MTSTEHAHIIAQLQHDQLGTECRTALTTLRTNIIGPAFARVAYWEPRPCPPRTEFP